MHFHCMDLMSAYLRRGWIKMTFPLFDPDPDIANYGQARAAACIVPPSSSCPVSPVVCRQVLDTTHDRGMDRQPGGTEQYTYGTQLPDCFFMTNILPGSHRAAYIISLQAYLCMDGKFLFEHQSSYQLFLTTKYYSFSRFFSGK